MREDEVKVLDMCVDDAIKSVISAGVVYPSNTAAAQLAVPGGAGLAKMKRPVMTLILDGAEFQREELHAQVVGLGILNRDNGQLFHEGPSTPAGGDSVMPGNVVAPPVTAPGQGAGAQTRLEQTPDGEMSGAYLAGSDSRQGGAFAGSRAADLPGFSAADTVAQDGHAEARLTAAAGNRPLPVRAEAVGTSAGQTGASQVGAGGIEINIPAAEGRIVGTGASDHLVGGIGTEIMFGGNGDDVINGRGGRSLLTKGDVEDTFVSLPQDVGTVSGPGPIIDFCALDRIGLSDFGLYLAKGDAFGGTPGELLIRNVGSAVSLIGDLDGVGRQDFTIFATGGSADNSDQIILAGNVDGGAPVDPDPTNPAPIDLTPPAVVNPEILTNPSVGVGLNGVTDWTSQMPFIDIFKTSRPWVGHLEGQWGGATKEQIEAVSDADGYLTELPAGVTHVSALLLTELPAEMTSMSGRYRLAYHGHGDITINHASNVVYGDGEIWFDYEPRGNNLISIDITGINGSDYVRDISVVQEKNISAFEEGRIFNPDWIKLIDDMRSLRFMDWQATNNSAQTEWSDRANVSDATWGSEAGVPLEIMVQLANETGTDPWFNIPHLATEDYIRNFVTYVKDYLDPDLKPYFEYSNEVWNWGFGQAHWAHQEGQKLWPGVGDAWVQFYGMKAAEMAQVIDEIYGPNANALVNKVISTQTGWRGLEAGVLEAPNAVAGGSAQPASLFNYYGVTGYFDGALGREKAPTVLEWVSDSKSAAMTAGNALGLSGAVLSDYVEQHKYDQAISLAVDELRDGSTTGDPDGSIASLMETFAYHKAVADAYGLDMVMYEGGTHVVGVGEWSSNQELADFFVALNQSDAMGGLYLELMNGWKDAGGTLFNAFVDVGKHGIYGSWGALQHLDDQSERWDAIVEFNENNPGWWQDRGDGDFIGTREITASSGNAGEGFGSK
ncbi:hypothetical protein ACFFIZ_19765 [Paracoccus rhizosphaerae]|uniref:Hemolysin-type calcium-binding repeat-containing protein n=1 Tax=Paracoccus rhizosphaerae TaxID=1133347 RepID=A0ABV6CP16_9RHOB